MTQKRNQVICSRSHHRGGGAQHSTVASSATFSSFYLVFVLVSLFLIFILSVLCLKVVSESWVTRSAILSRSGQITWLVTSGSGRVTSQMFRPGSKSVLFYRYDDN